MLDKCMYIYSKYVCVYSFMRMYGVCVFYTGCIPVRVYNYIRVSSYARLRITAIQTHSCDLNSVTGDPKLCSLWTRHKGNLKTDL